MCNVWLKIAQIWSFFFFFERFYFFHLLTLQYKLSVFIILQVKI